MQVWSNACFHDQESLGDVLADAVDEGIGVVLCAYAARATGEAAERGMALGGRLWQQYRPCTRGFVESGIELRLIPSLRTLKQHPECAAVLEGTAGFSGGKESVHQVLTQAAIMQRARSIVHNHNFFLTSNLPNNFFLQNLLLVSQQESMTCYKKNGAGLGAVICCPFCCDYC